MAEIVVEDNQGVVWVTINRPAVHNALSREVNLRLQDIALGFEERDDVRVVVLTGAGEKTFCAGADLKERKSVSAEDSQPFLQAIRGAIASWGDIRVPTICLMNGSAFGGGLELAMACDFRIVVDHAKLALTEVKLGIMPGAGGTQRLPRLVGEARAKELILLGRRITAQRALEIGLVHDVVTTAQLRAAGEALLGELAACAPLSVRSAKAAIERGHGKPMSDALDIEYDCYERTLFSDDRNEGLAAFAEGRAPRFAGR